MVVFKPHHALSIIAPYVPSDPVIVEAGAFKGHDTVRLAQELPGGTVHAFEPVPDLYAALVERTKLLDNVRCYSYALSGLTGHSELHVSYKADHTITQASSLMKPQERLAWSPITFPHTIAVPTITLNDWLVRYAIPRVDLMWLDLQGCELAVMQAASRCMAMVSALHVEVGFLRNYEGQPLYHEITEWLAQQGFKVVAQDFANTEDWFFGNILCVRR
jgi:2-O-methyltransferase